MMTTLEIIYFSIPPVLGIIFLCAVAFTIAYVILNRRVSLSKAAKGSSQQTLLSALQNTNNIPEEVLTDISSNKAFDISKLMFDLLDNENTTAIENLIKIAPDINQTNDQGETLLEKALMYRNFAVAKLLLARDDTTLDNKACYIAFKAIANNTYDNNMTNVIFNDTISAAMLAASWGNENLVKHFLNTPQQIHNPRNIILQASKHGWEDIVHKCLYECHFELCNNANEIDTFTIEKCLYEAAKGKSEKTLLILIDLIDENMLVDSSGRIGEILITIANNSHVNTYNCYKKIFETIGRNDHLAQYLNRATRVDNPNYVKIGINRNYIINQTILIIAARFGHIEVVTSLLQFDEIDIDAKSWLTDSGALGAIKHMLTVYKTPPIKPLTLCYIAILQKKTSMSFISTLSSLINNDTETNPDYILPSKMLKPAKEILSDTAQYMQSVYKHVPIPDDCKNIICEYLDSP